MYKIVTTVKEPKYSNCVPNRKYKVKQVSEGYYKVKSRAFGLFIDSRDIVSK